MPLDIGGSQFGLPNQADEAQAQEDAAAAAALDVDTAAREQLIGVAAPGSGGGGSAFDTATLVRSAISLHMSQTIPNVQWTKAVDPIADRFLEMFGTDPVMVSSIQDDLNTLLALTDDQIAAKITRGEPLQQAAPLWDAIREVAWEVGADELAARLQTESTDAVKGTFDALTRDDAYTLATGQTDPTVPAGPMVPGTYEATQAQVRAAAIETLFDVGGAWSYSPSGNLLAVTVGDQTIAVTPDPGFDPETHLDVVAEVVRAQASGDVAYGELTGGQDVGPGVVEQVVSFAHDVGGFLDENPELRASVDQLWNDATRYTLFNVLEVAQGRGTPLIPESGELGPVGRGMNDVKTAEGKITEESIRQASILPFPEDAIIVTLAQRLMADSKGALTGKDALGLAADSVEENRDQLRDDFEGLTSDELVKELTADIEGQTGFGKAVEKGLDTALRTLVAYDGFTQRIGVTVVDAFADFIGGAEQLVLKGNTEEAFQRFSDLFTETPDDPTVGDYFDLEGAWYDGINLAASIGFDPLNYIFVGGKGAAKLAERALTNPKFAGVYLKMGRFPKIAELIATAGRRNVESIITETASSATRHQSAIDAAMGAAKDADPRLFGVEVIDGTEYVVERSGQMVAGPEGDFVLQPGGSIVKSTKVDELVTIEDEIVRSAVPAETVGSAQMVYQGRRVGVEEAKAVRVVASMASSGLDAPELVDLVKLALDPAATVDQVNAVWKRGLAKDWLPDDTLGPIRHQSIEGFGGKIEDWLGGRLSQGQLDSLMKFFEKAAVGRTFKLGENQALGQIADILIALHPADKDAFTMKFLRAVEGAANAGDRQALAGAQAMIQEQARRKIVETGGTLKMVVRGEDFQGVADNIRQIEDALVHLDDQIPETGLVPGFAQSGEDLFHGTRRDFETFDPTQAGGPTSRGRQPGTPQREAQGAKFYFSDDPAIASRFAEAGIPDSSLSEILERLDIGIEDVEADDLQRVFDDRSTVLMGTEVDDAGNFIYEVVDDGADMLAKFEASGAGVDEVSIRRLREGVSPRVVKTKVFGQKLDLTGDLKELPEELIAALRADGLIDDAFTTPQIRNWEQHEGQFANTAEWMRANGYGKAVVPDSFESGGKSIIGLAEYIGDDAAEVAGRVGAAGAKSPRDEVRTQLETMHTRMSARLEESAPKVSAAKLKRRTAQKTLAKSVRLNADNAANAVRNEMAYQVHVIYDEWAVAMNDEIGYEVIPVMKGAVNPAAPDVPVRDWSAVTGMRKTAFTDDPDLGVMLGLAGDDAELATQARAIGMVNRSQHIPLPASPYEMILFQKLGGPGKKMEQFTRVVRNQFVRQVSGTIKTIFGLNLLANPLTATKITLDETLRFLTDTGEVGKFIRATVAGLPGAGSATEKIVRTVRRIAAKNGEMIVNPYATAFKRNVGGWSADDYANYGWVDRPGAFRRAGTERGRYREQVERWLNGTILQDRRFQSYARHIDSATTLPDGTLLPPDEFVRWWDEGEGASRPGSADVKRVTLKLRGQNVIGTDLTAVDAFNIIDNIFNKWLDTLVDLKQAPKLKERLLQSARTPGGRLDLEADAQLLNAVTRVPGLSPNTGLGSGIFQMFFGGPSGRRAGVFFEHYYDEAYQILAKRHGDRLLTVDRLIDVAGVDKQTAELWLRQGTDNRIVAQLVRESGFRTEGQLSARAAAYAERRSDDLMYRFTATSMAGRAVESGLLFPFARAQTDFLSWWWDHLTTPMTFRLSPERRAALPQFVTDAVQGVESIPLNLRALAKYSHIVAAYNNDEPSWIDQTIDGMTFFPLKFDGNFLIDVVPQFGIIPSWLFDHAAEKNLLDDETVTNMMTLFPALAYSEVDPDPWLDILNRYLPNSRRSVRDLTLGALRTGYALAGTDVFTDPGVMGKLANIIAENKIPAATGDFQVALVADVLKDHVWELVPGSPEWDEAIREAALTGALEANKQEWSQDMLDRVYPLSAYDAEYRSLSSYEKMFSEPVFASMTEAGLFEMNDMLTNDAGVPRVRQAWDNYQAGTATPDELAYLDDALTTAYFKAGEKEILPGFTYLDYLNLTAPEMAVNLVAKNEFSGIPIRATDDHQVGTASLTLSEFYQNYIDRQTQRLINVPPGPQGADFVADARRLGWLVSRPVEEWAEDAAQAVYKSGQKAIRGVWETVSFRTWQAGLTQGITDKTFVLGDTEALLLNRAGMTVTEGTQYTYGEFHELLHDFDERFKITPAVTLKGFDDSPTHGKLAKFDDEFGLGLLDALHEADLAFSRADITSIEDWPTATKDDVRARFTEAINLGYMTEADYKQDLEPLFGPIDYEPPVPPPVDQLETGFQITGDDLGDVSVIDGDTIAILLDDGPLRVRLIGINAPEVTEEGYQEARAQLDAVVAGASEITVGVYKPELFGLTQQSSATEQRILAWVYIDGVPLYDPTAFSVDDPRGAGLGGGKVVDLVSLLEGTS